MRALQYRRSVGRYALQKALGGRLPRARLGLAPLTLCDLPEVPLPTPQWVRIAPHLAGICGSDLATITAHGSPYLAPVTSLPFVMGHELVGTVTQVGTEVTHITGGERVVLRPALGCAVRGIDPPCDPCARGCYALCRNVTRGDIAPGIQTGFCRDTGGAWSDSLVAHQSQVFRVPDELDDRAAVLVEPFACALHGALRVTPGPDDTVLIIGCGTLGLLTIAALRGAGCRARLVALGRFAHQREHARRLGADEVLEAWGTVEERYTRWAGALQAEMLKAELGKPVVIGGADYTFDCVASSRSLDDSIRFTAAGGTLVLAGMPGVPQGVDWTPMWFKELTVRASYAYGTETVAQQRQDTFTYALELMREWGSKLAPLVSEPYELEQYPQALRAALGIEPSPAIKTIFNVRQG